MKTYACIAAWIFALGLGAGVKAAEDFYIFKAIPSLPVTQVEIGQNVDKIVQTKLSSDDIINLVKGRKLGSEVDNKSEALGAALTFEVSGSTHFSKLIVFDPNVPANYLPVFETTSLTGTSAYLAKSSKIFGFGQGNIIATTAGNPAQNGFAATTLSGALLGSFKHVVPPYEKTAVVRGVATLSGPVNFISDSVRTEGVLANGRFRIVGKPLGTFTE